MLADGMPPTGGAGFVAMDSKKCFIIMPYGTKPDANGNPIDFDEVYREVFVEPVEFMGFQAIRSDEITQAGSIHREMFARIAADDVVIVDITTGNPNVFYELGVRHALKPSVTILTKRRGTVVPFNIQDQRIIEYPGSSGSMAEARNQIREFIKAGLASYEPDSPIFTILQDARKDWKRERITALEERSYRMQAQPGKQVSVITGDIRQWPGIDVWVNSENTNMQMARYYDRSLSALIRYEGAEKDQNGEIIEDTIASELALAVGKRESVTAGTIYVTGAGALAATLGVKRIFHAATSYGVPGRGYQVMQGVEQCVTNALRRMDQRYPDEQLQTVVFPMMGTGEGGGDVYAIAPKLIGSVVSYFTSNPGSQVSKVYFSAWNMRDLEACQASLNTLAEVRQVEPA